MFAFFKSLPETFYSVSFYQNLVRQGRGIGIGFLILASFLGVGQSIVHYASPLKALWDEREAIFESLPPLTIQNGQLSIDAPSPLELTFLQGNENGPLKIVFDLEADSSNVAKITKRMDDEALFVFVTRNKVFLYDKNSGRAEISDVKKMKETTITRENWQKAGQTFSYFAPFSIAFSMSFILFFGHLFTAMAGSVFLFILLPLMKLSLPFSALMRVTAAAKIPVGVLFLIVPPNPLIQLPLWLGFALFGLLSARKAGAAA